MEIWPLGVFASIDAGLGVQLEVARELGIPTIQLHAPQRSTRTSAQAAEFLARLERFGIQLTCVFGGFDGESYADIPTVEQTVGLVPEETRGERVQEMLEISDFAKQLQCSAIGLHLGFIPHDTQSVSYSDIVQVTQKLCEHANQNNQTVHLETGQETADSLLQFIQDVNCANLGINFDPANMILYGTGEPIEALKKVARHVKSVHCKDATWSDQPGKTWGQEVPLGEGQVNIESYLTTLQEIGYKGPLTIEREIPHEPEKQKMEIGQAQSLLEQIKQKIWATKNSG